MTIGDKVHQALSQAESLKSQVESFGHDTSDPQAKNQYYQMAQAIEQQVVTPLRARVNYVESQEPQYKVKQQAAQKAQQHAAQQMQQGMQNQQMQQGLQNQQVQQGLQNQQTQQRQHGQQFR